LKRERTPWGVARRKRKKKALKEKEKGRRVLQSFGKKEVSATGIGKSTSQNPPRGGKKKNYELRKKNFTPPGKRRKIGDQRALQFLKGVGGSPGGRKKKRSIIIILSSIKKKGGGVIHHLIHKGGRGRKKKDGASGGYGRRRGRAVRLSFTAGKRTFVSSSAKRGGKKGLGRGD